MDREHRMLKAEILQAQGMKQKDIAELLGVTDRTVRNYLARSGQTFVGRPRPGKLDGYKGFDRHGLGGGPGLQP